MSLRDDIQELQQDFLQRMPKETVDLIMGATDRLVRTGIAEKSLKEGDKLPAFSLPDATGTPLSSSALLQAGPLVINFYRGGWCPYCNLELRAFQQALPEINALGAQLVAISPNLPDQSLSSIEKHALSFPVLSDVGNELARQCGLVFALDAALRPLYQQFNIDIAAFNGDDSYELPIPATYVVASDGTIKLAFVDADYSKRLDPLDVIEALRQLRQ
ncbi:MAG: peroxiredoxin-like family protein [Pseudomonadales bacterium]|nr:peroxiredoxin-like family protein [Pseudomonadales bacterium]